MHQPCLRFCLFFMSDSTICNRVYLSSACLIRKSLWWLTSPITRTSGLQSEESSCFHSRAVKTPTWLSLPSQGQTVPTTSVLQPLCSQSWAAAPAWPCSPFGLPRCQLGWSCPQDVAASLFKHVYRMMRSLLP